MAPLQTSTPIRAAQCQEITEVGLLGQLSEHNPLRWDRRDVHGAERAARSDSLLGRNANGPDVRPPVGGVYVSSPTGAHLLPRSHSPARGPAGSPGICRAAQPGSGSTTFYPRHRETATAIGGTPMTGHDPERIDGTWIVTESLQHRHTDRLRVEPRDAILDPGEVAESPEVVLGRPLSWCVGLVQPSSTGTRQRAARRHPGPGTAANAIAERFIMCRRRP